MGDEQERDQIRVCERATSDPPRSPEALTADFRASLRDVLAAVDRRNDEVIGADLNDGLDPVNLNPRRQRIN